VISVQVLEAAASKIAGQPTIILCEKMPPTHIKGTIIEGYVDFNKDTGEPIPVIHMSKNNCTLLSRLDDNPSYNEGRALGYLNHEATHIRTKSSNEPYVECTQWRNSWPMVKLFKFPPKVNRVLLAGMKLGHYETPSNYRTIC
jgi:hypothetical protein